MMRDLLLERLASGRHVLSIYVPIVTFRRLRAVLLRRHVLSIYVPMVTFPGGPRGRTPWGLQFFFAIRSSHNVASTSLPPDLHV